MKGKNHPLTGHRRAAFDASVVPTAQQFMEAYDALQHLASSKVSEHRQGKSVASNHTDDDPNSPSVGTPDDDDTIAPVVAPSDANHAAE